MDKKYHELLNALVREAHPYPELAVKRALYASSRFTGAGLSKIPQSVFNDEVSSKSEAKRTYDAIDDSVDVEAAYLARKDIELESQLGFDSALAYYYRDSDTEDEINQDIIDTDLGIKVAPDIPRILLPDSSIPDEFKGIFDEVRRVFADDSVRGYDRSDKDRKRVTADLTTLIEKIGNLT